MSEKGVLYLRSKGGDFYEKIPKATIGKGFRTKSYTKSLEVTYRKIGGGNNEEVSKTTAGEGCCTKGYTKSLVSI